MKREIDGLDLTNADLAREIATAHELTFAQLWHRIMDCEGRMIIFTTPRLISSLGVTKKSIGTIRSRIESGRVHGTWRHGKARVIHLSPGAVHELTEDE